VNEGFAAFSPDGQFIAYQSDASGRDEVYVQARDSRSARVQV
jgi:Tol biopolymer transport system component